MRLLPIYRLPGRFLQIAQNDMQQKSGRRGNSCNNSNKNKDPLLP